MMMSIEAARAQLLDDDAWAYGKENAGPRPAPRRKDPRQNAPPTISRLHGDARTRVLAGRAEAYRRSHLASYERPSAPTRQRDTFAVRYQYVLTAAIIFAIVIWAVSK